MFNGILPRMDRKSILGYLAVFASAFCFYMSTVVIKWSAMAGLHIRTSMFTLSRFSLGFVVVCVIIALGNHKIRVVKRRFLVGRALLNTMAVFCFFKGVAHSSVAQANILNMTFPLFIALFSWFFFKSQRDLGTVSIVLVAFAGVYMILMPSDTHFSLGALWGLASGIIAAFAIIILNMARQDHDTLTILFFMFGLGGIVVFSLFFHEMQLPNTLEMKYLFWCSAIAIAGQFLLTQGFKYVTAIEGGIIASTRIFLAAILGPFLVMDPALSWAGWVGALLIFTGNVLLTVKKVRKFAGRSSDDPTSCQVVTKAR
ncbi:DMT family transporter [uncultured Desulfobacter sp.]|uniref:DMT family transporter n=1 Tax=uncultured Desulfobacter sp. TaxID=240139 RepID=UPI0029F59A37|nr:DMT family transporter [uncultured Desulfobacter sp.]